MWWSSFCAVLADLWRFMLDRTSAKSQPHSQPVQTTPRIPRPTVLQAAQTPVAQTAPLVLLHERIRYDKDHSDTRAIRNYLRTETDITTRSTDLTAYEWLAYQYLRTGRDMPWSQLSETPVGQWHQILRNVPAVVIGDSPTTHALVEWTARGVGHLGVVTAVAPDMKITIAQLGDILPGVVTQVPYTQVQWQALQPLFISVR